MTDREFADLIGGGETHGIEFKTAGLRTDKTLFARVARAVMALANARGGFVVIGIEEPKSGRFVLRGLTAAQRRTWTSNGVAESMLRYASPAPLIAVLPVKYTGPSPWHRRPVSGDRPKYFIVIRVEEFAEVPIICKEPYDLVHPSGEKKAILRRSGLYIRPSDKAESREIETETELRELLGRAMRKSGDIHFSTGRMYMEQFAALVAERLTLKPRPVDRTKQDPEADVKAFERQRGTLK